MRRVFLFLSLSLSLSACSVFREPLPTPSPTPIARVSADEVVQAMAADDFYATYGHTTLLVSGTVAAVDPRAGHFTLSLATQSGAPLECDLGSAAPAVHVGDAVTVRSANPNDDVQRLDDGVLIQNCSLS